MPFGAQHFEEIEVRMKSGMGDSLVAQFASIVDTVGRQKEAVSAELPSVADPNVNQILYKYISVVSFWVHTL